VRPLASAPVAIIGGGIAGCSAAIALGLAGRRALIVERAADRAPPIGETLPAAAKPLLRALGVWDEFVAENHLPSAGTVSVWGDPEPVIADAIFDRNGHGWQVDRLRFGNLLRRSAVAAGGTFHDDASLVAVERGNGRWTLQIAGRAGLESVQADVVIDASGRRSAFARMAGATRQYADNLVCRHARFGGPGAGNDFDSRTWVESVADGWWYSARLPGGERVVAFLTDGDVMPDATSTAHGFIERLRATQWIRRLVYEHSLDLVHGPHTIAARSSRLLPASGAGWFAAGDAAFAFDPLAGQGMWTALLTGFWAARNDAPGPSAEYQSQLDSIWSGFANARLLTYAGETRWPESTFWRRRAGPAGAF